MVQLPALGVLPLDIASVFQSRDARQANALNRQLTQAKLGQFQASQQRRNALAPLVGPALAGDRAKLGQVAGLDPALALKIQDALIKQSDAKRKKTASEADIVGRLMSGVNTPEGYFSALQQAKNMGVDVSGAPEQFSPKTVQLLTNTALTTKDVVARIDAAKKGTVLSQGQVLVNQQGDVTARGMPKPDNKLVEVFDKTSPTGTRLVPRSKAVGMPGKPSKGIQVTTNPDGTVNVSIGGKGQGTISKPTKAKLEADLIKTSEGIARLEQVAAAYKPEYQQVGMRFSQALNEFRDKFSDTPVSVFLGNVSPKDAAILTKFSAFKRDAIANINLYIKEITGAQMSELEADRLRKGMPDPGDAITDGDSPIVFKAKLDATLKALKAAAARKYFTLRNGISISKIPLASMARIIDARGQEIESELRAANPGLAEDALSQEVAARLHKEFGI